MRHIGWNELEAPVRHAIEARTGPVRASRNAVEHQAAILEAVGELPHHANAWIRAFVKTGAPEMTRTDSAIEFRARAPASCGGEQLKSPCSIRVAGEHALLENAGAR